jgi:transposase
MTHREASAALGLSVRQVQRIKASFKEAGASSLVHGNAGLKPSHYVSCAVRNLVAERARSLWKGASARHMSELLLAEEGCSVSSKTITRILKETGLKSPLSHKGARKQKEKDPDGALRTDASDRRLSLRLALEGFDDLPSRRHR